MTRKLVSEDRVAIWAALLFPTYVALQLLPLPLPLLHLFNPARAAISDSLGLVTSIPSSASLTIASDKTWMHLPRVVGYALAFLAAINASLRFRHWPWMTAMPLILLGTAEAILGLSQSGAGVSVAGTYGSKNHFVGLLEMVFPLGLALALSVVQASRRRSFGALDVVTFLGAGAAALAMFIAIPLSLSRAGFLSMIGSLGVMAGVVVLPRATRWQRTGMIAAVPVLVAIVLAILPTEGLIASLGTLLQGDGRWPVAVDSLRMFADFPLFGIGLGTYYPGFLRYQTSALDTAWTTTHNDYLQFLNELGVVGVLFPAIVVTMVLHRTYRASQAGRDSASGFVALGCLGGLSAMLFHSVADFNMYVPANAMAFMYIAGIGLGSGAHAEAPPRTTRPDSLVLRSAWVALCGWLMFNSVAWLSFLQRYEADPSAETAFCRVGVCNYYVALAATKARYDDLPARVPPEHLVSLLARDPAGGYNWIDLGESLEAHGRIDAARTAFARGLELGPNIPLFQMRTASFHLRQRDFRVGLPLMARSFVGNPTYEEAGFGVYQQHQVPLNDVLHFGLGSQRTAQAYLRKLLRDGNVDHAEKTWTWLVDKGWVDDQLAGDYVGGLVTARDFSRAASAWSEYHARSGRTRPESEYNFNGGFEWDPASGPFDWNLRPTQGVKVTLDDAVKLAGARSARLEFDGTENVTGIGLTQGVWLPAGRYRLQAMVKTEGVTTREGVALAIEGPGINVSTESKVGTNDWAPVACEFDVPAEVGVVQLKVVRPRVFRFDNRIAGTAWIDQVSITKVGPDPL